MYFFLIIILTLTILYVCLIITYNYAWHKVIYTKRKFQITAPNTFSIIIPARNEEANIISLLESIINNSYDKDYYEIIIVDDFSTDYTVSKIKFFISQHIDYKIRLLQLSDFIDEESRINAFKKTALNIGINHAQFEHIITIDADCLVGRNWLNEYNITFNEPNTLFVAGPVKFIAKGAKNTLYYFQDLDFTTMQGITPAVNYLKLGNMCNGANLGFSKKAFYEVNGYEDINHLASGDDMMLMHKFTTKFGPCISYINHANGIVHTYAQDTWKNLFHQRIRWASKSGKYSDNKLNLTLALVYVYNLSIMVLGIYVIFNTEYLPILTYLLLIKTIIELTFLLPITRFYNNTSSLLYFPWLQPLHICYIVSVGFLGMVGKYTWKDRTVR